MVVPRGVDNEDERRWRGGRRRKLYKRKSYLLMFGWWDPIQAVGSSCSVGGEKLFLQIF